VDRWLAACVVLAGCNQVFGIEDTEVFVDPCPMDRDCDGVTDEVDNCPALENSTQADTDIDGAGDACDPCGMAFDASMDTDGDGVLPANDRCPVAADASQLDSDGDGVGDVCDPDPTTRDTLRCVTDFRLQADVARVWPLGESWKWLTRLMHTPADTPPFAIVARGTPLPAEGAVEVLLVLSGSDTDLATGVAIAASDGTLVARCELVRAGGGVPTFQLADARGPLASAPFSPGGNPQALTIGYRATQGGTELRCSARSAGDAPATVMATTDAPFEAAAAALTAMTTVVVFDGLSIYETTR